MNAPLRFPILELVGVMAAFAVHAAEPVMPPPQPAYPLWNGRESVKLYARRANLPQTKALDLGHGVRLELALIPAGTFTMGTPNPPAVDEMHFFTHIWMGQFALALSVGVLLVSAAFVILRAIREGLRPQMSLGRLLFMIAGVGAAVFGAFHWRNSVRSFDAAQASYKAALTRYRKGGGQETSSHETQLTENLYAGKYEMTQARFKWLEEDMTVAHEVTLTRPFYIAPYEVKQAQYQDVMGDNPSRFRGPDLPVDSVSWDEAQTFCSRLSERLGLAVRLPTEAEWEYACRAGSDTNYCTGDALEDLDRVAWYAGTSEGRPHPVGRKAPSVWGIYDIHGNVWEWCLDWHGQYKPSAVTDPAGPAKGNCRVKRGGSFRSDGARECCSAYRGSGPPGPPVADTGFRVVLELEP